MNNFAVCLNLIVYFSYVFQSLVILTVLISYLEALYQLLFRFKPLAVYIFSYTLLFI